MLVAFHAQFEKDLKHLESKKIAAQLEATILSIKNANTISEIKNIKKLKGFSNSYRIRMGEYRIGIYYDGTTIAFSRFLHRKDIYRYFP